MGDRVDDEHDRRALTRERLPACLQVVRDLRRRLRFGDQRIVRTGIHWSRASGCERFETASSTITSSETRGSNTLPNSSILKEERALVHKNGRLMHDACRTLPTEISRASGSR